MAVTSVTFAQSAGHTTSTATTTDFTPGSGEYLFAATWARNGSAYIDTTISDSLGLTWTEIGSGFDGPADNAFFRMRLWYTASTATLMNVSSTPASGNPNGVMVARVAMNTPDVSNVAGDPDDNGDPSATLSGTPAHVLTFAVSQGGGAWTQPSGYTEVHDVALASNSFRVACAYDLTSPGNPASWTNTNNLNSVAVAIELLEDTGGGGITGTLAATESGSDTASLAGVVPIDGALTATEAGSDTAAFAGNAPVTGTLAATETGEDTAAFSGTQTITGSLAAQESGADISAIIGNVIVQGSLTVSESGSDTASLAGTVQVSGTLAATETGADIASISGTAAPPITGTMAATETGADIAVFTGPSIPLALIRFGRAARGQTRTRVAVGHSPRSRVVAGRR